MQVNQIQGLLQYYNFYVKKLIDILMKPEQYYYNHEILKTFERRGQDTERYQWEMVYFRSKRLHSHQAGLKKTYCRDLKPYA